MLATIGTILLLILKIIGILLLIIVGLALVIIMVVLFVPFRYKATGYFDEKVFVQVKFYWLLHLLNGWYELHDKVSDVHVNIAFFQVVPKKKVVKNKKKKRTTKNAIKVETVQSSHSQKSLQTKDEIHKDEIHKDEIHKDQTHKDQTHKEAKKKGANSVQRENERKIDSKKKNKKNKKKKKDKKKSKVKEKNASLEKIRIVWAFLKKDENKGLLKHILKYVGRLIHWVFPRKACANIEFGLEDPATTGYITGLTSIIYVKSKGNFIIKPNFHEEVIKGTFKIKGRLYLYQLIYYIIRIIIDKRVRKMLKLLKKM